MMVAISSSLRSAISAIGSLSLIMSSHFLHLSEDRHGHPSALGHKGKLMTGVSSGTPFFISSHGFSSNLPTNTSFDSECSRMYDTVSPVRVGYTGTVTKPAIMAAMSAMIHQEQFLEQIATFDPGSRSSDFRYDAIFLHSTRHSSKVHVFRLASPPPMGCVMRVLGPCASQLARKVLRRVSFSDMVPLSAVASLSAASAVALVGSPAQHNASIGLSVVVSVVVLNSDGLGSILTGGCGNGLRDERGDVERAGSGEVMKADGIPCEPCKMLSVFD
mmetsp:Transcript_13007/g.38209  ORF Transcript_13007/g.38209 Transcript_13007/m.38209 type:complete len:274 (+) Transcript_13007:1363-2184(+)